MLTRPLHHLRQNLIAYIALFVALGGTSYAAFNLPRNSVGARQIRNHSIDAVKLNPRSIAASIKAWVNVQWRGDNLVAMSSSTPVRVITTNQGEDLIWTGQRFSRRCFASATPQVNFNSQLNTGYVNVQFTEPGSRHLFVFGFGPDGSRRAQAAFVMVICP